MKARMLDSYLCRMYRKNRCTNVDKCPWKKCHLNGSMTCDVFGVIGKMGQKVGERVYGGGK